MEGGWTCLGLYGGWSSENRVRKCAKEAEQDLKALMWNLKALTQTEDSQGLYVKSQGLDWNRRLRVKSQGLDVKSQGLDSDRRCSGANSRAWPGISRPWGLTGFDFCGFFNWARNTFLHLLIHLKEPVHIYIIGLRGFWEEEQVGEHVTTTRRRHSLHSFLCILRSRRYFWMLVRICFLNLDLVLLYCFRHIPIMFTFEPMMMSCSIMN